MVECKKCNKRRENWKLRSEIFKRLGLDNEARIAEHKAQYSLCDTCSILEWIIAQAKIGKAEITKDLTSIVLRAWSNQQEKMVRIYIKGNKIEIVSVHGKTERDSYEFIRTLQGFLLKQLLKQLSNGEKNV